MSQVKATTREEEIEMAYAQREKQVREDREKVWEKVEAERNKGKDL